MECGPQGTSIAFTLRLKPLENETGTEATPEPQRAPTITVVAESAVDRQALAHMITTLGCNSTQARSMREALECNREAPALMLVAQYPHDGPAEADALGRFEAEALKVGLPIFKALAVTKDNTRWDELADTGYTHALLEPVDAEAFAATLREVLDEAGFTDHGPVVSAVSAPDPAAEESAPVPPAEDIPLPVHEVGSPEPENHIRRCCHQHPGAGAEPATRPFRPRCFLAECPAGYWRIHGFSTVDAAVVHAITEFWHRRPVWHAPAHDGRFPSGRRRCAH